MGRAPEIRAYRPAFVGMGLLACLLFLVLAAMPAYGAWVAAVLGALWLVLFALSCRWFTSSPRRLPVIACLGLLAWLAAVALASVML